MRQKKFICHARGALMHKQCSFNVNWVSIFYLPDGITGERSRMNLLSFMRSIRIRGEGADTSARVPYAKQLKDVSAYQPEEVLKGEDGWNPVANGNVLLSNLKR